jgi:hypothetical protein
MQVNMEQQQPMDCMQCSVPPRQPSIAQRWFLNLSLPSIPWKRFFFVVFCAGSDGGQRSKKSP